MRKTTESERLWIRDNYVFKDAKATYIEFCELFEPLTIKQYAKLAYRTRRGDTETTEEAKLRHEKRVGRETTHIWNRRRYIADLKVSTGCLVCGESRHGSILDYHHVDPTFKSFGIAQGGITAPLPVLLKEIKKCVVLCSNCHRLLHAGVLELPDGVI